MKIIQVTWIDAIGGGDEWLTKEELRREVPHKHYSLGYLVHETKDALTISMSHDDEEDSMGGWLCIPKKYIQSVRELTVKRK